MSIKANDFGRVADRIHIMPDTSVTLQACGGGMGAKTGLYLLPIVVQACGDRDNMAMQGVSAVVYVDTTHADDVVRTDDIVAPLQERDYKGGKLIVYAIQGSMIGREDKNGPQGEGVGEDVSFTLNTVDRHAVAYTLQIRCGCEGGGKGPLIQTNWNTADRHNEDNRS